MERLTAKRDEGGYEVDAGLIECGEGTCRGRAIDRLAAYEDMQEMLEAQYEKTAERLEVLKAQGKLKTAQAQQLLAQKLTYSNMLGLIGVHSD
ncbi:hypothetical protein [Raoultibacter massiliensis]|uniref:Uncharacterized protein n=1 Tax=Raoultibacter massiliensis TaxID=1852371 RepID=A0ABV1JF14_9ACTN|nr:hypothetical protein [Raoultibacter massiliensis]